MANVNQDFEKNKSDLAHGLRYTRLLTIVLASGVRLELTSFHETKERASEWEGNIHAKIDGAIEAGDEVALYVGHKHNDDAALARLIAVTGESSLMECDWIPIRPKNISFISFGGDEIFGTVNTSEPELKTQAA